MFEKRLYAFCKFGNFRENSIFANGVERHICDVKNSRQRHDLPISVNDRVISPFHEGLFSRNFAYAKFRENKTLAKIYEFTVCNKHQNLTNWLECFSIQQACADIDEKRNDSYSQNKYLGPKTTMPS